MMLDVFRGDAFSFTELTTTVINTPYVPTLIGDLGLFTPDGVSTLTIAIEMMGDVLSLVPASPRGSPGVPKNIEKRNVRDFRTTHLKQRVAVQADEVQGIRVFGSQTETETALAYLQKKIRVARRDLDLTHEWQRMGAIKGVVLDADGTTVLYNYFTEFGVTQQTLDFALDVPGTLIRSKTTTLERMMEDTLGGIRFTGVKVLASQEWFDAFVDHPAVVETYKYSEGRMLRENPRDGFQFGAMNVQEYRGSIGGTRFIAAGEAYAVPLGVPDLFQTFFAPGDYMDTVNTIGLPFYMKGREMDFDRGLEYEIQSNPLHICTRPRAVIRLTI